jgi:hypothetical protein
MYVLPLSFLQTGLKGAPDKFCSGALIQDTWRCYRLQVQLHCNIMALAESESWVSLSLNRTIFYLKILQGWQVE